EREEREVATEPDVAAWGDSLTDLSHQDASGVDVLAAEDLHAAALGVRITTVAGGAAAFFVCHGLALNGGNREGSKVLPVPVLALVTLAALELEHHEPLAAVLGDDLRLHLGALHERRAELRAIAAEEEDVREFDLVARAPGKELD